MRRPLGITFIILFYLILGGLTLSFSFLQLFSVFNQGMKLFFMDVCYDFIADNTILKKEFLILLPQNLIQFATFTVTFLTSVFYTILADALYLGNAKAYFIGIALHSYSAVSSVTLWILGINTLKLIGIFLFSMNTVKAVYLYTRKSKHKPIDEEKKK